MLERPLFPAILPTYNRSTIAFEKGEGAYLFATDGKRYLNFASGIAVTALGHSHPHLVKALIEQGQKLWHCSNIFTIPGQERMAQRMVAASFADSVFFCNSGAEAVECAVKIARKYQHETGHPEKYRIICMNNAFHGRTLTTIFAGGQEKHTKGFGPEVPGFDHVAFGNMNELRAKITPETGGIMVEPIQGEGGIAAASSDYMRALRQVADEYGLLLIFDEVQCGMGRTGKLFAHEWSGVTPDICATAKGIGGGFPLGACLATEKAAKGMTAGTHGSTYGGNPLAMAVGNAVLDVVLAPGFLENVVKMGGYLRHRMEKLIAARGNIFVEPRGQGLLAGLRCADKVNSVDMVARLREAGLLTVGAGQNVVRLAPPLIVAEQHIDEAMAILDQVAATWKMAAE